MNSKQGCEVEIIARFEDSSKPFAKQPTQSLRNDNLNQD